MAFVRAGVRLPGGQGFKPGPGGRVKISIEGIDEVLANLKKVSRNAEEQVINAVDEELKTLIQMSKSKTPVKTGRLKESTRKVKTKVGPRGNVQFQVLVGGIKVRGIMVDYALHVHETHKSMSKFLSTAFNAWRRGVEKRIARRVRIG